MITVFSSVLANWGSSRGGEPSKRPFRGRGLSILAVLGSLVLALMFTPSAHAQSTQNTTIQPDCLIPFTLAAAGNSPTANVANAANDNRNKGCSSWTLKYQSSTLTGVTVTLQSGCSTSTTVTYGTFAGQIPTTPTGNANPIVSDTGGELDAINGTACISWVRVNVAATGSGTLTGVLYGFRNSSSAAVNGGGGSSNCPAGAAGDVQYYVSAGVCGGDPTISINGTPLALVVTNSGSAFGSLAVANNDLSFPFPDSSTGLAVAEHTANPNFDYNAFLSYVGVDLDKGATAATFDLQLQTDVTTNSNAVSAGVLTGTHNFESLSGISMALMSGAGVQDVGQNYSGYVSSFNTNGTTLQNLIGYYTQSNFTNGSVGNVYGFYMNNMQLSGTTITGLYTVWTQALGGLATNGYSFWEDEQGVFRIKADNTFNSVYQAIPALYNPQFTKYTPGAANYERCIPACQWSSNVAQIGNEAAGTGTLRQTQEIGVGFIAVSKAFAALTALTNGTYLYCSDCTVTSGSDNTCAGSGSGAFATRINGAWACEI
jgi:hypothetical protein